jgi:glycosyltransferase involved in cell wall biosynthesis
MRIAQVSTLSTPVRRTGSGSTEGLVWLLTRELTRMSHEVTVFGAAGSEVDGGLVATLPGTYGEPGVPDDWQLCEWINLCRAVEQSGRFDVLHSHAYLWGLPLEPMSRAPVVHTLHISPYENDARLRQMWPGACVTAISRYQWSQYPQLQPGPVIYHGVDPDQFTLNTKPEDYVCFLGRFTSGKGPWHAVQVARELGMRLLLAGPRNDYYRQHIEPLVDGRLVEYVGSVTGAERDKLLGGARALLYPVQSPEPFGLVPVEAMMCGTPVAAVRLGAVPEIVDEGVTGYCADSAGELAAQVVKCMELDRVKVRERAQERFSAERMAREYAALYKRIASGER